ncbi:Co/Zn/Cd efflux system component [Rhizobium leguminosarum]|nr:Co/Zn/Cd efflux system component [Rhizobium leguminosarum]
MLPRTWILLRDTTNVLLEGVSGGLNLAETRAAVASVPGVAGVHDLHVWSTSSDDVSFTAHVEIVDGEDPLALRQIVEEMLEKRFSIEHSTIQVEAKGEEHDGHNFHP